MRKDKNEIALNDQRRSNGLGVPLWAIAGVVLVGAAGVYWYVRKKREEEAAKKEEEKRAFASKMKGLLPGLKSMADKTIADLGYKYPGTQTANWNTFGLVYNEVASKRADADPASVNIVKKDPSEFFAATTQVLRWIQSYDGATLRAKWLAFLNDVGVSEPTPAG